MREREAYQQALQQVNLDYQGFTTPEKQFNEAYDPMVKGLNQVYIYTFIDNSIQVKVMKHHPQAKIPMKAHEEDAGHDLALVEQVKLPPFESTTVSIGLAFQIPKGYYGQIQPRSSMARGGLTTDAGVIDSSYTGECFIVLVNRTNKIMTLDQGSKICQILFLPVNTLPLKEVSNIHPTSA
jgi:dUTP pyrophosphatase